MRIELHITPEILNLIAKIDEFKGRWEALGNISRDHLTQLRRIATIESVGSSTRIEGSRLSDAQVEELLTKIEVEKLGTRDEQEVAGYASAMNTIYDSWEHLPVNENYIKQLHSILLSHSSKDDRHRGSYKTLDNHVAAFDHEGNQIGVIVETSSPFDTPEHMRDLVDWYKTSDDEIHPLLRISVFVVWFLAIHPFQDGNGRISRVLTTLQLLREGYDYVPYASIERIIEDNKEQYYRALRTTQQSFKSNEVDWNTWIVFFLRTLWKQCETLANKVELHKVIRVENLSPLGIRVIEALGEHDLLSNKEIVSLLDSNSNTIKTLMTKLYKDGFIDRVGKGRATKYRLKK